LPAPDRDVDISRIDFDAARSAPRPFSRDHGCSRSHKRVQDNAIAARAVFDRISHQRDRFDGRVHGKFLKPPGARGADPGILPDIRATAAILAEFKVIDVGARTGFPDKDEFVLAAVEAAHAGIGLGPDAQVLQLGIDLVTGRHHFDDVAPVHADVMNGCVRAVCDQMPEHRREEAGEGFLAHLATRHGEFAMPDDALAADMAVDRHMDR